MPIVVAEEREERMSSNVFDGCGMLINGLVYLSPKEALPFLEADAVLVDLRSGLGRNGREFKVKNVLLLPFAELEVRLDTLPRDRPLVLADYVGLRSKEAAEILKSRGFESIASLRGGMVDWIDAGMPIAYDRDEELTGQCACQLRPSKVFRSGC